MSTSRTHSYGAYTRGCRCEACRRAKADYMRDRRAAARARAATPDRKGPYIAPITRHGTRAGYEEHGCRCLDCTAARAAADRRHYAARKGTP